MLSQVDERDDDRGAKEATKGDAEGATRADPEVRVVARRAVHEGAVPEHARAVALQHQEAVGDVGQRAVGP